MTSLLVIVQDATNRIGVPQPSSAIDNPDVSTRQLTSFAQQEVRELARAHPWQVLQKEKTFTATATETQASVIPTDFDRFVFKTFFNRTGNRIVSGPLTAQEWQDFKGRSAVVVYDAFRQRGNDLIMMPVPDAGDEYAFEYICNTPVVDANGTTFRTKFLADDDEPLLDSELVTLGIIWRFRKAKGLDYAEDFRTYQMQLMQLKARDAGQRAYDFSRAGDPRTPRFPLVPDANWDL